MKKGPSGPFFAKYCMNIRDIENYDLSNAIEFNEELNPKLFQNDNLNPEIRQRLLIIAADFMEHLGVSDIEVTDIIIAGSNAAYTYTDHSDLDLHIIVDIDNNDELYKELFLAKKTVYNEEHDIKIKGIEVELYMEGTESNLKSLGVYSVLMNKWIHFPSKVVSDIDETIAKSKYDKLALLATFALNTRNYKTISSVIDTLKKYRQAGLEKSGEFSPENLAYKMLRGTGMVDKLYRTKGHLHSHSLSIEGAMMESSGYIPSPAEKDDDRWSNALSVDVDPFTMKNQAKAMGLGNIRRDGIPQNSRTNGKYEI